MRVKNKQTNKQTNFLFINILYSKIHSFIKTMSLSLSLFFFFFLSREWTMVLKFFFVFFFSLAVLSPYVHAPPKLNLSLFICTNIQRRILTKEKKGKKKCLFVFLARLLSLFFFIFSVVVLVVIFRAWKTSSLNLLNK